MAFGGWKCDILGRAVPPGDRPWNCPGKRAPLGKLRDWTTKQEGKVNLPAGYRLGRHCEPGWAEYVYPPMDARLERLGHEVVFLDFIGSGFDEGREAMLGAFD